MTTWILVYDAGQAKLSSVESRDDDWPLVMGFEHRNGRELFRDIRLPTPPGRMQKNKVPVIC